MEKQKRRIKNKIEIKITTIFLIIEIVIYIAFMYLDCSEKGSNIISNNLKFIGIILCFLFSMILYSKNTDQKDIYILRAALLFTLISDLCILILNRYTLGTMTFCIVQVLYLIRLYRFKKQIGIKSSLWKYLIRNGLITIGVIFILITFKVKFDWLVIVSILYFVSIVLNVGDAIWIAYKSKALKTIIFAFGMVLFLLCDINVGLFNISDFVAIDGVLFSKIYAFATIAMWMFYLPAQVGIALSGYSDVFWKRGKCIEKY